MAQTHQLPDESLIKSGRQAVKCGKAEELSEIAENLKQSGRQAIKCGKAEDLSEIAEILKQIAPLKTKRALDLAQEKDSSIWLTVLLEGWERNA